NDSWAVHGSLGLLQTEIDAYGVRPEAQGRDLAHAPPYTLNIGTTWSSPSGWYARLDINAVGSYYFDVSHDQKSDSYELVNLKIGKKWDQWSVYLWGRNIFDENYSVRGFYFGNEPPLFPPTLYTKFGDPRHYGITLGFHY
ncbi:MAG: TonB-dependent receptor, partial [Gammaproteobacteria bacterium]